MWLRVRLWSCPSGYKSWPYHLKLPMFWNKNLVKSWLGKFEKQYCYVYNPLLMVGLNDPLLWCFLHVPCPVVHICVFVIIDLKVILRFFLQGIYPQFERTGCTLRSHPAFSNGQKPCLLCISCTRLHTWMLAKANPVRQGRRLGSLNIRSSVALWPCSFSQIWYQKSP